MSEKHPENKNNQPSFEQIEQAITNENAGFIARETISQDPDGRPLMVASKILEAEIETETSVKIRKERSAQKEAQRQSELRKPAKSIEDLVLELQAGKAKEKAQHSEKAELDSTLLEIMLRARDTTLEVGQVVSGHLKETGVEPDTMITILPPKDDSSPTRKKRFRRHKPSTEIEKAQFKEMKGWYLEGVAGQTEKHTKVFLCEDGQILTARGKFFSKNKETSRDKNEISIPANVDKMDTVVAGYAKGNPFRRIETYSSFITKNDDFTSDLGLAPKSSGVVDNHSIVMAREEELQKAMLNLVSLHTENQPQKKDKPQLQIEGPKKELTQNVETLSNSEALQLLSYADVISGQQAREYQEKLQNNPTAKEYIDQLIQVSEGIGKSNLLLSAANIRKIMLEEAERIGLPVSARGQSISWALWAIARESYLGEKSSASLDDEEDGTSVSVKISFGHLGLEGERAYKEKGDLDFLNIDSEKRKKAVDTILNGSKNKKGNLKRNELERLGILLRG